MKLGTIEGGGTKFVVGVGDENGNIFERLLLGVNNLKYE